MFWSSEVRLSEASGFNRLNPPQFPVAVAFYCCEDILQGDAYIFDNV
jgi:hypothetical protein